MFKRSSILCILLATSTIFAIENQHDNTTSDPSDQMQMLYNAITQNYDAHTIKKHEEQLEQELRRYLCACMENEAYISQTQDIEKAARSLLEYLRKIAQPDEAYSAASMAFILSWTQIINELATTIIQEEQVERLQQATDAIRDLVEKMFLEPMNQMLEEQGE